MQEFQNFFSIICSCLYFVLTFLRGLAEDDSVFLAGTRRSHSEYECLGSPLIHLLTSMLMPSGGCTVAKDSMVLS